MEDRHLFGAGRTQILNEQGYFIFRQGRRAGSYDLVHVFLGLDLRVDAADAEPLHIGIKGHSQMRRRIRRAQMHGFAVLDQTQRDGCSNGGFANTTFAHDHDQPALIIRKLGNQFRELGMFEA
ncbi:hypothetical protein D3C81_1526150 [compost metagenome]